MRLPKFFSTPQTKRSSLVIDSVLLSVADIAETFLYPADSCNVPYNLQQEFKANHLVLGVKCAYLTIAFKTNIRFAKEADICNWKQKRT